MISELVNKQFIVIDDLEIKTKKSASSSNTNNNNNNTTSPIVSGQGSPKPLSPIISPHNSRPRRTSSLTKDQLEIRKVYDKISQSPVYNVPDKLIEKNQKSFLLSNDESLLLYYFRDWLDVMEEQPLEQLDDFKRTSSSNHTNSSSSMQQLRWIKKKDQLQMKVHLYDLDDYPLYFPLSLMSDGNFNDPDFVKFGISFSVVPSAATNHAVPQEKTFVFMEDGLVHMVEKNEPSEVHIPRDYESESLCVKSVTQTCKILKRLQQICKVIKEFNVDMMYGDNDKGGSFYFCREMAKLFSEESSLVSCLSENVKHLFKVWKERHDKKLKDEEDELEFQNDTFYSQNEHVPMDDLSKIIKHASQSTPEAIREHLMHPSAYEVILEKVCCDLQYYPTLVEFYTPVKKQHYKFKSYAEFDQFLCEQYNDRNKIRELRQKHPMDYLYLKIMHRKLWCCKVANSLYDPLVSRDHLFDIKGRQTFFKDPETLIHHFGDASSVTIDYEALKKSKDGKTVKVLSLDGGGMRGLVLIEQLKAIEECTGKRIGELFDIVCGSSTGGIIAFFIEAGFTMDEVKSQYLAMGRDIFNMHSHFTTLKKAIKFLRGKSWYESKILEKYFKKNAGAIDLYSATKTKPFTFVCGTIKPEKALEQGSKVSTNFTEQFPFIFRTYTNPFISTKEAAKKLLDPANDFISKNIYNDLFYAGTTTGRGVKITNALRATTAAPIFFDAAYIGNDYFTDGGLTANNPSVIALSEAMRMYLGHNKFVFVSLGTGKKRRSPSQDSDLLNSNANDTIKKTRGFIENLIVTASDLKLLVDLVTSSERIHAQMVTMVKLLNERDLNADISYYRFDPPEVGKYDLDSVTPSVIEEYETKTRDYIRTNEEFPAMCKRLLQE
ncbi:hypothetical protein C9374_012097 [Naegleria lovaniensis]|uniref:PNPLA domain-containing protein n=1 Tax=Naegleria lovaniensis TaxID=51637 RepID=A0AA88KC37_NAELO|nr:uncharacterized protein C9374_012097 [Naegleria lovaniensis]KAG2373490.1 hypothetical protein C9374_012097 [Naegleria lovaniensis]